MLTRRTLLAATSASAVFAGLPTRAVMAGTSAPPVAPPPLPTWIVGTPGEADHEVIRALTREAAIIFRAEACDFEDDPDADPSDGEGGPDCECEACHSRGGYEATRVAAWDGRPKAGITSGDWVDAGFESPCDRCGYEASLDGDGRNVGGKAVCGDCMTIADWEAIDPEYAAELRAEADPSARIAPAPPAKPGDRP